MPKLRTYRSFKSEFKTQAYVKANVLNARQRSAVVKMRNGTYPLEIELGRYRGIPVENRVCILCRSEPETEDHFLLNCAKTDDIRQKLISDVNGVLLRSGIAFQTLSFADKLSVLLLNVLVAKYVGKYVLLQFLFIAFLLLSLFLQSRKI